jgi:riboflavin kinase / FMN adenylyltransferase
VKVARSPGELGPGRRAAALGSFDGVHRGHRLVVEAALEAAHGAGLTPMVIAFDPDPRDATGAEAPLLATEERRLELLAELGIAETLVVAPDAGLSPLAAESFADRLLRAIGVEAVVAGEAFRFGSGDDLSSLAQLGFRTTVVPELEGVTTAAIRVTIADGEIEVAAGMLGRPPELEGDVVGGDARGRTLGFPTANLAVAPRLALPPYGIYAGAAAGHRAAISIGVNPHYGGGELRIEAFLLDFTDDLYGRRLRLELWRRLRPERAFESELELVEQIARDVEETRGAIRPG